MVVKVGVMELKGRRGMRLDKVCGMELVQKLISANAKRCTGKAATVEKVEKLNGTSLVES